MKKYIFILLSLLTFSSCITSQKCNDKFPPIERDTLIVLQIDTILQLDSVPYVLDFKELSPSESLKDIMAKMLSKKDETSVSPVWQELNSSPISTNKVRAILEVKGDSIRAKCEADSLQIIIHDLVVNLSFERAELVKYKDLYHDTSMELKLIQEDTKVEKAKTRRYALIAIPIILLIIGAIVAIIKWT